MRILHIVVTGNFAGTERYVCDVGRACAGLGDDVTVVGGDPARMSRELGNDVRWMPGASPVAATRAVRAAGRFDVCHMHLTHAEAVGVALRRSHRGRLVSTRHIAAHRGTTRVGRQFAPWIARHLDREIAISRFVAARLERPPTHVVPNGVRPSPVLWRPENNVALVLQRLEPEKDTWTAIEGWHRSHLADRGWSLRIVGDGSQRSNLEAATADGLVPGVTFAGQSDDVGGELARAGVLIAPAPAEPLGLSVLEAMAAGIPVLAADAGGHQETVGSLPDPLLFRPHDPIDLSRVLRSLATEPDSKRALRSQLGREWQGTRHSLASHVAAVRAVYC